MSETTLLITFQLPLSLAEVTSFRGAVLNAITEGKDVLMHNHQDDSLRYAYPLVQYKSIEGKAAILCIAEGVDTSGALMQACNKRLNIGRDRTHRLLKVDRMMPGQCEVEIGQVQKYSIRNWLPLNEKNYRRFYSVTTTEEKLEILEHVLIGHILSFAKGVNLYFEEQVRCQICQVLQCDSPYYKSIGLAAFDIEFLCNVSLPDYIGLGKHASVGYGMLTRIE